MKLLRLLILTHLLIPTIIINGQEYNKIDSLEGNPYYILPKTTFLIEVPVVETVLPHA